MKNRLNFVQSMVVFGCALLAGCAGFTEDVSGQTAAVEPDNDVHGLPETSSEVNMVETRFSAAQVMQTGKVLRDASGDSVTLVFETNGGCIREGESFVYDSGFYFADSNTFAYSFRGDTLVLSFDEVYTDQKGDTLHHEAMLLVGGTPGELDGIWKFTQCFYVDGNYGCNDDSYDEYMYIDGATVELRKIDREDYDYMNTIFVEFLFDFIGGRYNDIQLNAIVFHANADYWAEKNGIEIREHTNRNMKFAYGEYDFELNLDYVHFGDSLSLTLQSGSTTCVAEYHKVDNVPSQMCVADNAMYLSENVKSGAQEYRKGNDVEFEACIDGILGREGD